MIGFTAMISFCLEVLNLDYFAWCCAGVVAAIFACVIASLTSFSRRPR